MRKVRTLLPALALAFVAACAQPSGQLLTTQSELDAYWQQWDAMDLNDYRFTFERSCFCPPEFRPRVAITVKNREVESVHDAHSGNLLADPPYSYTIDDLFAIIQGAVDEGAVTVSVSYDPRFGHPVDVYIDTYANVADEEFSMAVRDLVELPVGSR